jgi:hypothetical protein
MGIFSDAASLGLFLETALNYTTGGLLGLRSLDIPLPGGCICIHEAL